MIALNGVNIGDGADKPNDITYQVNNENKKGLLTPKQTMSGAAVEGYAKPNRNLDMTIDRNEGMGPRRNQKLHPLETRHVRPVSNDVERLRKIFWNSDPVQKK